MQRFIKRIKEQLKQWEFLCSAKKIKQEGKRKIGAGKGSASFKTPGKKHQLRLKTVPNINDFNAIVTGKMVLLLQRVEILLSEKLPSTWYWKGRK
jgi:hypothetical protein